MNSLHTVYINSRQLVASLGAVIHGCWNSFVKVAESSFGEALTEMYLSTNVREVVALPHRDQPRMSIQMPRLRRYIWCFVYCLVAKAVTAAH